MAALIHSPSPFYTAALRYAARGWKVFPLLPKAKEPATKHGVKDASSDPEQIAYWWARNQRYNIGLATGSGRVAVDIDGERGIASLAQLIAKNGLLPIGPNQVTSKGGHFLFGVQEKIQNQTCSAKKPTRFGWGIDVRADGGYILGAPSVHPSGHIYAWTGVDFPIPDAPEWMLLLLRKPKIPMKEGNGSTKPLPLGERYSSAALQSEYELVARAARGTRNSSLNLAAHNLGQLCASGDLKRMEVEGALISAASHNGYLGEHGIEHVKSVIASGLAAGMEKPRDGKPKRSPPHLKLVQNGKYEPDEATPDWETTLLRTQNGLKRDSIHNGVLVLNDTAGACLEYNEFSGLIVVKGRPPWHPRGLPFEPHTLNDPEITRARCWLDYNGISVTQAATLHALEAIAHLRRVHPVRDALRSFVWDGVERIDRWLCDYMGAPETAFVCQVGAKWLISAVARIMRPGCKVDTMLILEGGQGARKSSALEELAEFDGVSYHLGELHGLGTKEAIIQIQGNFIVEMAELDALKRAAQATQIKAFLSCRSDKIRPPYGKTTVPWPRQCVFAGTHNPDGSGYLEDPTGGRRFWPVTVGDIDLDRLKEDRDQLWAEAVAKFDAGETWWLTEAGVIAEAKEEQEQRATEEPFMHRLKMWLTKKTQCTTAEILQDCWGLATRDINRGWTTRAGQAMARVGGWTRKRLSDDDGERFWAFVKIGFEPDEVGQIDRLDTRLDEEI